MLAKRIIPTMLVRGATLVKGERFKGDRSVGHAAQAARVHAARGVDELIVLDIGATAEGRGPDLALIRQLSEEVFIPITVGGGVRSLLDIDALLRAGADKVAICSGAWEVAGLAFQAAERFGRQAIVGVVEYDANGVTSRNATRRQGRTAREWAKSLEFSGAGEILLQRTDTDGTLTGYDLGTIYDVSHAVNVPVVASGGGRGPLDMLEAIQHGADACAAGALFQFTDTTPRDCARFLKSNGVEVRCN